MSELPAEQPVTTADVFRWYEMQDQLDKLKKSETLLRSHIFKGLFKSPTEGVNTLPLTDLYALSGMPDDGHVIKGTYKINRSVDKAALTANQADIREKHPSIKLDEVIEWKPELRIGAYKKLTAEEQLIIDRLLTIKPGMPELEVVLPKPRGKKGE